MGEISSFLHYTYYTEIIFGAVFIPNYLFYKTSCSFTIACLVLQTVPSPAWVTTKCCQDEKSSKCNIIR